MFGLYGLQADAQATADAMVAAAAPTAIDGFLLRYPEPSSSEIADFLKAFAAGSDRDLAAQALIARGAKPGAVSSALTFLDSSGKLTKSAIYGVLTLLSAGASAFHGYRRNKSVGWGAWWGIMGGMFPVVTPAIGLAQGWAKEKTK